MGYSWSGQGARLGSNNAANNFVSGYNPNEEALNQMRQFETGATRNTDEGKFDYEGFFSPLVLARRAEYMHKHRKQADGKLRDSANWQKGIPLDAYMKSAWRHFFEWWAIHRNVGVPDMLEDALCALMFNAEGYLHELIKKKL